LILINISSYASPAFAVDPNLIIVLKTEAWGGRNTDSYRNEPPESSKITKKKFLIRNRI
jgi:hypothetical protein